jgi:hypothetical protein
MTYFKVVPEPELYKMMQLRNTECNHTVCFVYMLLSNFNDFVLNIIFQVQDFSRILSEIKVVVSCP